MLVSVLSLIGGLVLLVFAGDYLVRGAVGLADKMGIPPLIVGLTIVAFGTSAPELVVAIDAAIHDAPGLALGYPSQLPQLPEVGVSQAGSPGMSIPQPSPTPVSNWGTHGHQAPVTPPVNWTPQGSVFPVLAGSAGQS